MKIDCVIPFRESPSGRTELSFCLRGIEKHLKNVGNVYVIRDVVEKPLDYAHKEWDIFSKLLSAANDPKVSDPFMYFNDDHFLLSDFEAAQFPNYHSGKNFGGHGDYIKTIQNTRDIIGPGMHNFDIHCPMLVTKAGVRALDKYDWSKPWGYLLKTLYAYENSQAGTYMADFKLNEPFLTKEMILDHLKDRRWFSTSDRMFTASLAMAEALNELYGKS